MKKSVFLLAIFMLPILSFAYDAEIDGIYYNLVPKAKEAEVTSGDKKYTGDVVISPSFTHDGVTYTVNKISDGAFSSCEFLNSVYIPGSVKIISANAFRGCRTLNTVIMENGVEKIDSWAFSGCNLKTVEIPASIREIGDWPFDYNPLEKVIIQDIASWCNVKFGYHPDTNPLNITHHLYLSTNVDQEVTNLVIPNGVTSIGNDVFRGCLYLTSISIPNSVTSIGSYAFAGCTGLTSITIPNSVTYLNGFNDCTGLTSLNIPNSVTTIGGSAFAGCKGLISITIPNSVTSIENNAFAKCPNLEDVYCYKEDPALSGGGWLSNWDANSIFSESYIEYATLHVPSESIDSYKSTAPWSGFGKIVSLTGEEEKEQCAAPTISYANGTLTFACATKDAKIEYNYTISANGSGTAESGGVKPKYTLIVKAWANAEGYDTSDTVTATLESSDTGSGNKGDVNEDGVVNISDVVKVINIMAGDE